MKKKAAKSSEKAAKALADDQTRWEPTPASPPAATGRGSVTLWGEILAENGGHLKMAIKNHGDALDLGLCGTHWIAKRQIFGNPRHADGFDYIRVSYAYASLLAQSSQQCE